MKNNKNLSSSILYYLSVILIFSFVITDFVRVRTESQTILISGIPFLVAVFGTIIIFTLGNYKYITNNRSLEKSIVVLSLLCLYGVFIGFANNLSGRSIIAGFISYASPLPGIILGYVTSYNKTVNYKVGIVTFSVLIFCFSIAIFQQFGIMEVSIDTLEGTPELRGVDGVGQFRYMPGPFRNPSVFSAFIAFSTSIIIMAFCNKISRKIHILLILVFIMVAILVSLLAARRSGTIMLIAAIFPLILYFFCKQPRFTLLSVVIFFAVPLIFLGQITIDDSLQAKLSHFFSSKAGYVDRSTQVFTLNQSDFNLISVFGMGIGATGPGAIADGAQSAYLDKIFLQNHPVLHYGWFKNLYMFGFLGSILHILFFYYLYKSTKWPKNNRKGHCVYPSISLLVVAVAFVYFFIATSWIQSLTGGVLFGYTIGFGAGTFRSLVFPIAIPTLSMLERV